MPDSSYEEALQHFQVYQIHFIPFMPAMKLICSELESKKRTYLQCIDGGYTRVLGKALPKPKKCIVLANLKRSALVECVHGAGVAKLTMTNPP